MTTIGTVCWLRRATPDDLGFLKQLFRATDAVLQEMPLAWQDAMAEMQYRGREVTYAQSFPDAVNWIICDGEDVPVGRHLVESRKGVLHSIDLAILPARQGQGIGSMVLRTLMAAGVPIQLRVVKHNRAFGFYQRLGFRVTAQDDLAFDLLWVPSPSGTPEAVHF